MPNLSNGTQANEKQVQYTIITKTSSDFKKGTTDSAIHIQLIGKDGKCATPWFRLDNLFRDDFELGRTDKFTVKTKNVGLPEVIRIKINKTKDHNGWLCETVTVVNSNNERVLFNLYDIIYDQVAIRSGKAELPQKETLPLIRDMRRIEVENKKGTYQWHLLPGEDQPGWCLPRYGSAEDYLELPMIFQINDEQLNNFRGHREIALQNTLIEFGKSLFKESKLTCMDDYRKFFRHPSLPKEMPAFHNSWHMDEEFGRQTLNGVNPTTICLCEELLPEFVPAEKEIFANGETSESVIKAKRLYYINYRKYSCGVKRNCNKAGKQLHCCDTICLLLVGEDKKLRPIAIQLEKNGHVFTPRDSEHDWLLAKLYFRNTDVNIHEWKYHFLRTHAVMEPFAIGMFRSLSRHHPLYKLLRPHLQTIPAINTLARVNLIGPGAAANLCLSMNGVEMARCAFKTLEYDDLVIPNLLKKQGVDDPEALPFYHFRDDALLLWDATTKFVTSIIQLYYKEDKEVCEDYELAEFVRTVAVDGIEWAGHGLKDFPTELRSVSELIDYTTVIIFTCSTQHAASNFGQFEIYKFIPNAPAGMRLPPHKKGEGSLQRILDSLPDSIMSCLQVGTSFTLSTFSPNEVYLGNYPQKLFLEEEVGPQQEEFRRDLREISRKIHERNKSLTIPYLYLLPEKIPNNIAV